jgi:hypothetical protein
MGSFDPASFNHQAFDTPNPLSELEAEALYFLLHEPGVLPALATILARFAEQVLEDHQP